jgi:hypothetical protein
MSLEIFCLFCGNKSLSGTWKYEFRELPLITSLRGGGGGGAAGGRVLEKTDTSPLAPRYVLEVGM